MPNNTKCECGDDVVVFGEGDFVYRSKYCAKCAVKHEAEEAERKQKQQESDKHRRKIEEEYRTKQATQLIVPKKYWKAEIEDLSKDLQKKIKLCMDELPFLQKEALVLREYEKMSYEDIAATMKQRVNTVKSLIHRARMNLKQKLLPIVQEAGRG